MIKGLVILLLLLVSVVGEAYGQDNDRCWNYVTGAGWGLTDGTSINGITGAAWGTYDSDWGLAGESSGGMDPITGLPIPPPVYPYPQYFAKPPTGQQKLSPMAIQYLKRLYENYSTEGQPTVAYTIEQPETVEGLPPPAPIKGMTTERMPGAASAQTYRNLEAAGAIPNLQQYVTEILQIPWESYVGTIKAMWPGQQKRTAQWATAKQK